MIITKTNRIEAWQSSTLSYLNPLDTFQRVIVTPEPKCNLACEHCYFDHEIKDIVCEDWTSQIERMTQLDLQMVCTGRIMTQRVIDFCWKYVRVAKKKFDVVDNGYTIFKDRNLFPHFEEVSISIDGIREDHDRQRAKEGSFDVAINAVKQLQKENMDPIVSTCMTPFNFKNWEQFEEIVADLGTRLSCSPVLAIMATPERNTALFESDTQRKKAMETLVSGLPKLVNIYELADLEACLDVLKGQAWEYDDTGDGMSTFTSEGVKVFYRPHSVTMMTELSANWNGIICVNDEYSDVGFADIDLLPDYWGREIEKLNRHELHIWQKFT